MTANDFFCFYKRTIYTRALFSETSPVLLILLNTIFHEKIHLEKTNVSLPREIGFSNVFSVTTEKVNSLFRFPGNMIMLV